MSGQESTTVQAGANASANIPVIPCCRHRLPKSRIIAGRKEIRHLLDNGASWSCRHFKVRFLPSNSSRSRFAVLVSRKLGGAILRNRTKRRFREAFRTSRPTQEPGIDMVVFPASAVSEMKEIECSFLDFWASVRK